MSLGQKISNKGLFGGSEEGAGLLALGEWATARGDSVKKRVLGLMLSDVLDQTEFIR